MSEGLCTYLNTCNRERDRERERERERGSEVGGTERARVLFVRDRYCKTNFALMQLP